MPTDDVPLGQQCNRVDIQSVNATIDTVGDTGSKVVEEAPLHDAKRDDPRVLISLWLQSLSTDYKMRQEEALALHAPRAGGWFQDSQAFRRWIDGEVKKMGCCGMPGSGKTLMTALTVENLKARDDAEVMFIFCKHDQKSIQTLPRLFANLLGQLLEKQPILSAETQALYNEYLFRQPGVVPALEKILRILRSHISALERVFIVVDALDEWSVDNASKREELITKLESLGTKAHLFVTSRYAVPFSASDKDCVHLSLYTTKDDIRNYIEFNIHGPLAKCIDRSEGLREAVVDAITEKSNGVFLLVRLLFDSISSLRRPQAIREALTRLPCSLESAYELKMARIEAQNVEDRAAAMHTLAWMSLSIAKKRLHVVEIQHAIAMRTGMRGRLEDNLFDEEHILAVCCGLIAISVESNASQKPGRFFAFAHSTAEEFLHRRIHDYIPNAEREITETCLRYLSYAVPHLSEEAPHLRSCSSLSSKYCPENVFKSYPLCSYSAIHWPQHAKNIDENFDWSLAYDLYGNKLSPYLAHTQHLDLLGIRPTPDMSPHAYLTFLLSRFSLYRMLECHLCNCDDTIINITDGIGRSALFLSSGNGLIRTVELLLQRGANPNIFDKFKHTALSALAHRKWETSHRDMMELLLRNGADPNIPQAYGRVLLSLAAEVENLEMMEVLLENKALPGMADNYGRTPLYFAAGGGKVGAMKLLLAHHASVDRADHHGQTPFSFAAETGELDAMELLLQRSSSHSMVHAPDDEGRTPLSYAAEQGRIDVISFLLDHGAAADTPDNNNRSPLFYATLTDEIEVVSLLLERKGVNLNRQENPGLRTALSHAAERAHDRIMKLLLDNGADPDLPDRLGRAPISYAINSTRLPPGNISTRTIGILLERNVDINRMDGYGHSPLTLSLAPRLSDGVHDLLRQFELEPVQSQNF